jgi:hypothetical protein
VIRYTFREPSGDIFSKWEMKSTRGFSTSRPKGGTKSERFYDLDVIAGIFDSLIESIEGGESKRATYRIAVCSFRSIPCRTTRSSSATDQEADHDSVI